MWIIKFKQCKQFWFMFVISKYYYLHSASILSVRPVVGLHDKFLSG